MKRKKKTVPDAWCEAVDLTDRFLKTRERADFLWERTAGRVEGNDRSRCRSLYYGALRNIALIDWAIKQNVRRRPKGRLRALMLVAGFELLAALETGTGAEALVVHHAVERAKILVSGPEVRLANAVLRRLSGTLRPVLTAEPESAAGLALRFSHPEWLVARWVAAFGWAETRDLLSWNQRPSPWYLRVFEERSPDEARFLEPSPWEGFFRVGEGGRKAAERLLREGKAYAQDPSTRLAPELLGPAAGEAVLDLCAAPGGKSVAIARAMVEPGKAGGILVSLDLPGRRLRRLEENLLRYPWARGARVVGMDLLELTAAALEREGLPGTYDAVLLDAPCSNTGVFRRRVDARGALAPGKIDQLAALQLRLLRAAGDRVREGGRLVYSTCSIEAEENRAVVERFTAADPGAFVLEKAVEHYPWQTGHDGGGGFLLRRRAG